MRIVKEVREMLLRRGILLLGYVRWGEKKSIACKCASSRTVIPQPQHALHTFTRAGGWKRGWRRFRKCFCNPLKQDAVGILVMFMDIAVILFAETDSLETFITAFKRL